MLCNLSVTVLFNTFICVWLVYLFAWLFLRLFVACLFTFVLARSVGGCQAGPDPVVYSLVGWLQGASKTCHVSFKKEAKEREEKLASEKREVGAVSCVVQLFLLSTGVSGIEADEPR